MRNAADIFCNPSDETVERDEDGAGAGATEGDIPVDVSPTVNGVHLLELPKRVDGHEAVGFRDV